MLLRWCQVVTRDADAEGAAAGHYPDGGACCCGCYASAAVGVVDVVGWSLARRAVLLASTVVVGVKLL